MSRSIRLLSLPAVVLAVMLTSACQDDAQAPQAQQGTQNNANQKTTTQDVNHKPVVSDFVTAGQILTMAPGGAQNLAFTAKDEDAGDSISKITFSTNPEVIPAQNITVNTAGSNQTITFTVPAQPVQNYTVATVEVCDTHSACEQKSFGVSFALGNNTSGTTQSPSVISSFCTEITPKVAALINGKQPQVNADGTTKPDITSTLLNLGCTLAR